MKTILAISALWFVSAGTALAQVSIDMSSVPECDALISTTAVSGIGRTGSELKFEWSIVSLLDNRYVESDVIEDSFLIEDAVPVPNNEPSSVFTSHLINPQPLNTAMSDAIDADCDEHIKSGTLSAGSVCKAILTNVDCSARRQSPADSVDWHSLMTRESGLNSMDPDNPLRISLDVFPDLERSLAALERRRNSDPRVGTVADRHSLTEVPFLLASNGCEEVDSVTIRNGDRRWFQESVFQCRNGHVKLTETTTPRPVVTQSDRPLVDLRPGVKSIIRHHVSPTDQYLSSVNFDAPGVTVTAIHYSDAPQGRWFVELFSRSDEGLGR